MLPTQMRDDHLRGSSGNLEDSWQRELELLLQAQRNQRVANRERDFNICRSGSAPPTVDGSLSAVGSLFRKGNFTELNGGSGPGVNDVALTEDEIRSHPAYLSYYYSHENINPRLPPPLLSKEDWRIAQRFQNGGALIGEMEELRRKNLADKGDNSSLFAMQPSFSSQKMGNDLMDSWNVDRSDLVRVSSTEWLDRESDCLNGLRDNGMGSRRKSFADILQKGLDRPTSALGHLSHATSHDSFADIRLKNSIYDRHPIGSCNALESLESFHPDAVPSAFAGGQNHASFVSAVGSSLSRSTTPEQQLLGRATSFSVPPVGCRFTEKRPAVGMTCQNGQSLKVDDIAAALSGLSMSNIRQADQVSNYQGQLQLDLDNQEELLLRMSNGINMNRQQQLIDKTNGENPSFSSNYIDVTRRNNVIPNCSASMLRFNVEVNIPKRTSSSANLYSIASASGLGNLERTEHQHQNLNVPNVDLAGHLPGAYSLNEKLSSLIQNHTNAAPGKGAIGHSLSGQINLSGVNPHPLTMDPGFTQHLQNTHESQAHVLFGAEVPHATNYFDTSCEDPDAIQKAYLELLIAQHKQQQELLSKASSLNQNYLRTPYGLGMPYPANAMANSVLSSIGYGRSIPNEQIAGYASTTRNPTVVSGGLWHTEAGNNVEHKCSSSLLDEFKNNKSKSFELSDIVGHVIEFSTDQHGSRFIQQKLETATVEEKVKIFPEIISCACTLMTDVFGNYVIQKFFKHGTESQKMELASQVKGHVLQLSLQMYGCRVIQKALEVVDVDQQTQMVSELEGSVMRCVRDQNGNHVIQKCIECVPEDRIQFIFSAFYGEVVELATHPYGCRVIQRVLEHCRDQNTQKIIMGEIMQSVCTLAQDQYGNYVIQHVLEHGKPEERSAIISKLAGEIVKMSQQKFASNVVEKCLTFGGPDERQLLVNEMLGPTDENEPLQAMMKDPFGNYVVQKVIETCNDQSLELLLSRIKIHLNALKRYTYGKHIVSRVEKLIATGERRIRLPSLPTALKVLK